MRTNGALRGSLHRAGKPVQGRGEVTHRAVKRAGGRGAQRAQGAKATGRKDGRLIGGRGAGRAEGRGARGGREGAMNSGWAATHGHQLRCWWCTAGCGFACTGAVWASLLIESAQSSAPATNCVGGTGNAGWLACNGLAGGGLSSYHFTVCTTHGCAVHVAGLGYPWASEGPGGAPAAQTPADCGRPARSAARRSPARAKVVDRLGTGRSSYYQ